MKKKVYLFYKYEEDPTGCISNKSLLKIFEKEKDAKEAVETAKSTQCGSWENYIYEPFDIS